MNTKHDFKLVTLAKFGFICGIAVCLIGFSGCKKKEATSPFKSQLPQEESQVTVTSEDQLASPVPLEINEAGVKTETQTPTQVEKSGLQSTEQVNLQLPTQEAQVTEEYVSPTPEQVQAALKNAGYYKGNIDGKIGPGSKKAICSFQEANALGADGKVGKKTWSKLKAYLETQPAAVESKEQ